MTLISDLIDIPERVQKGDFVLRLTEGVTQVEQTLKDYVVTPELKDRFDDALTFMSKAVQSNSSRASYLHGSFGSGKSHFMAVLNLILQGISQAKSIRELAPVIAKHNKWIEGKKFLLVPYHAIGSASMESCILGGYADYIRRTHPQAPIPGVYLAEELFRDAQNLRQRMGDAEFFAALNETKDGWGDLSGGWTGDRFQQAIAEPPGIKNGLRPQLISDLIKQFFQSYNLQAEAQQEAFVSLDTGLSVMSNHAHQLGYDALILFLDELILWLASRAADLSFIHREGQKLSKLVEAQLADRPIPVISFVARQRDLSELIGDAVPGAERLNFSDALKHWESRFHRITLEDRNLPAIAEKRILKCKSEAARKELQASFEQATQVRESVMNVLLTSTGDREMFRLVYPFSPALIQTLIAVSSVLQRERTALKVMMQLLVDQRDTLTLGDIIPVGDLFDVVAHGDEAFSPEMAIHFDNAKRLYHQKLLPLLEKQHGRREDLATLPYDDAKRKAFRDDDRLVKTLLLSALVPEVESLRGLTSERLAALNHGTIRSPIPGRESQEVLRRCRLWAANIGEIRIGEEATNPAIKVQLSGVDTETILRHAEANDNYGNRIRLVREMVFQKLGIPNPNEQEQYHEFLWKNTKRSCIVLFKNIRELPDISLTNLDGDRWKLIIDFPFDEGGHNPRSDCARIQDYQADRRQGTKTLCWIPSFLSTDAQTDLGKLAILEHILSGERLAEFVTHLSPQDRQTAKTLLENQRSVLRQRVQTHLDVAYGINQTADTANSIDRTHSLQVGEQFVSLQPGLNLRPPVAADLGAAMEQLLDQALSYEFPAAPAFETDVQRLVNLEKVAKVLSEAARTADGRLEVERPLRLLVRQIANPLMLGDMGQDATHFVLGLHWKQHFIRKLSAHKVNTGEEGCRVEHLRQWIDDPKPMGLPKELQNLIILTYAEQTGRSFYRHNVPMEPTLKELPNDCELREQQLPDEKLWQVAVQRAESLLGLSISPLCKASNVADLENKVKAKAAQVADACHRYTTQLQQLAQDWQATEGDRLKTAGAMATIVARLHTQERQEVIAILAHADIATSETAMAECLNQVADLVPILQNTSWDLFKGLQQLTDDRQAKAREICQQVQQAIGNDEHVVPLGSTLKAASAAAVQLLTRSLSPSPNLIEPSALNPQPPKTGRRIIRQGNRENLSLKAAQDLMMELSQTTDAKQTISFHLTWMIEESETEESETES